MDSLSISHGLHQIPPKLLLYGGRAGSVRRIVLETLDPELLRSGYEDLQLLFSSRIDDEALSAALLRNPEPSPSV